MPLAAGLRSVNFSTFFPNLVPSEIDFDCAGLSELLLAESATFRAAKELPSHLLCIVPPPDEGKYGNPDTELLAIASEQISGRSCRKCDGRLIFPAEKVSSKGSKTHALNQ